MKLVLVVPSLGGGGAERVMTALANAWAQNGHAVTLITLTSGRDDQYLLDAAVHRIALDVAGRSSNLLEAIANNWTRIRALRRAIRLSQPDALLSFLTRTNVLVLLAAGRWRARVIVSERTAPGGHWAGGIWRALGRPLYRRAAAVVAQTRRGADELEATLGCTVKVIPNPVESGCGDSASGIPAATDPVRCGSSRTLLAVGRLVPKKGFDLLIDAFARIADRHPDWKLVILGEGRLRGILTQAIAAHRLADRIALPGFDKFIREAMRRADLFVLSSRGEGFPNVLLEAMSEGMACVSFDCETGPRELITHGENGWLVPAQDTRALAAALDTLMRDDALRARLGAKAREAGTAYSIPEIIGQWNALLAGIAAPGVRRTPITAEQA
ncbi:MAG: glycosyltransferase family 4 protein [Rhodanobacteraceae bacterium]